MADQQQAHIRLQNLFRGANFLEMSLGILLIIFAVLLDPLGISSPGFSRGQLLILTAGLFIIFIGILGRRSIDFYRRLTILLVNIVTILVMVEVGSGVVSWLISTEDEPALDTNVQDWRTIPYYSDKRWAESYWAEAAQLDIEYAPYVIWRNKPIHGDYINTDENGLRQTPHSQCSSDAYTVFVMGSSSTWGAGAPDWGTIPAYLLSALAEKRNQPICMVNFGQTAYVSTQGLIDLMLQLQAQVVPDLVIFYAGMNDILAAYESGLGDTHQNLARTAALFNQDVVQQLSLTEQMQQEFEDNSYFYPLLRHLLGNTLDEVRQEHTQPPTANVDVEALAAQIAATYFGNYQLVQTLAQGYGFKFVFFWSSYIGASEKSFTSAEKHILDGLDPRLTTLYDATFAYVQTVPYEHLHFIADVLETQSEQLWIDEYHVTPVGNEMLAQRMLDVILPQE